MEIDKTPSRSLARSRSILRLQVAVSTLCVIAGVAFPIYIALVYGIGAYDFYDRSGSVAGRASYFLLSIGLAFFAVAMGLIGILMAKRAIKVLDATDKVKH